MGLSKTRNKRSIGFVDEEKKKKKDDKNWTNEK